MDPFDADGDLDYMHARSLLAQLGRFLSADPRLGSAEDPASWNRYSYTQNTPLNYLDPSGEAISLDGLSDTEAQKLLKGLSEATGNTYGVDNNNQLTLLKMNDGASKSGTEILQNLISSEETFTATSCNNCAGIQFEATSQETKSILIDFTDFNNLDFGKVTPGSFSLGMVFLHESLHALNPNLSDPDAPGERGFFVDQTNMVRRERGFDLRTAYKGRRNYDRVTIPFEAHGLKRVLGYHNNISYSYRHVFLGVQPPGSP
jgi:RHS repeat-associated protein